MYIRAYDNLDYGIGQKLQNANIFFQSEYADYVHALNEEVLYLYDDERVMVVRYRKHFVFRFAVLLSEPYELVTDPCRALQDFLDEALDTLSSATHIQWAQSTASGLFYDTPSHNCKRIPFGSHVVDLTLPIDELWKKVHSKHRNVIRNAEKREITVRHGGLELLEDYVLLELDTSRRTGRHPNGREYYKRQIETLRDVVEVYIAYDEDIPQAGAIFFYNMTRCYYMFGATGYQAVNGAANLLIWEAMLNMKSAKIKEFSFVGCRINEDSDSKYHGIQRFKERFGGELIQGYLFRYERFHLMYSLFCKAMQYKMHLKKPYSDPIDEEIHKWASIQN